MADYERSTTATRLDGLPDVLRAAVQDQVDRRLLTVPADSPAFVSHNRRLKRSGFLRRATGSGDPDPEHWVAVVIGPKDVVVAVHGEQRGTSTMTLRLEDADVADLAAQYGDLAPKVDDHGVSIVGFPVSVEGGATGRGSFFVGLGAPDGEAASAALREAVRAAKA